MALTHTLKGCIVGGGSYQMPPRMHPTCWPTRPLRQQTLHNGVPRAVHKIGGKGGEGYSP